MNDYLIFAGGMITGSAATFILANNRHKVKIARIFADADSVIDKAEDLVQEKWARLKDKI